ncbi:unnamed protein product [Bathycoccus prasinos]
MFTSTTTINSVSSSAAASTSKASSSSSFSSKNRAMLKFSTNKERRRGEVFKVRAEPAKPKLKKAEEFTAGGGGARGYCDVEEIKNAIKECEGLEGKKLEACYAQYGCDINIVTDHYAKVAGVEKKSQDEK